VYRDCTYMHEDQDVKTILISSVMCVLYIIFTIKEEY
jgi:hypothetical protein